MAVRNFWIETNIDGRKTKLTGGPKNKLGGLTTKVYARNAGSIQLACKVVCRECAGDLIVMIYDKDGQLVYKNTTLR